MQATFVLARAIDSAGVLAAGGPTSASGPLLLTPAAQALGAYVGCRVLTVFCEELRRCLFAPVALHTVRSLTVTNFRQAHARDSAWHEAQPAGGLDRVFHRGSRAVQTLLSAVCFSLGPTCFEAAAVLVVLRRQFGWAVCACAALTFVATVAINVLANEKRKVMYTEANRRDNALSSFFVHSLRTHELVKLSSAERAECGAYEQRLGGLLALRVKLARSLAVLNTAQRAAFGGGMLAILLLALVDVRSGALLPSKLVVLNGLLRQLSSPLQQLGSSYTMARQACVDMGGLIELNKAARGADGLPRAELPPLAADLGSGALVFEGVCVDVPVRTAPTPGGETRAPAAQQQAGAAPLRASSEGGGAQAAEEGQEVDDDEEEEDDDDEDEEGKGEGRAKGAQAGGSPGGRGAKHSGARARAHARSQPTTRRILDGVSFAVARGERVAIVGPSGAGKSTLLRVLAQLQPPSEGRVLLGGHDLAAADPASVRRRLAIVPHESGLGALLERGADEQLADEEEDAGSAGTPAEWWQAAVRYAAPEASSEQVESALADLGLAGPQADRGETGGARAEERSQRPAGHGGLSAGELQRLSLARALCRTSAAVLACDEPTANLDALSAARASAALRRAAAERAVLVVAHDLRTVVDFERIVVLEGGRLVDSGTHAQLLQRCALYRQLWATQSRGTAAAAATVGVGGG